jgi:GT2 family glycosyltransferase
MPGLVSARDFLYAGIEGSAGPVRVESVIGAFMVIRREAMEEAGWFDEGYFMYAEDTDICRRIGRTRGVYLLPWIRVTHLVGGTRRRFRSRSEFHRTRSLRRFLLAGTGCWESVSLQVLSAWYLILQQAASACGVSEVEYSWQPRGGR